MSKHERVAVLGELLDAAGASRERCAYWVPGRVEVLGKHTDYAGGRSLLTAVEQGFVVVAGPRSDRQVRVIDAARARTASLALHGDLDDPEETWARYPATVLRRVARNFPEAATGADIAFQSDLPLASGMSSSSAFMVSVFLAVAAINGLDRTTRYSETITSCEALAGYLATVENGQSFGPLTGDHGVGTFGGSEDHTAMLCCREGELSVYSFCPVRHERQVVFPRGYLLAVAFSGVVAEKTGAARDRYNRASLAARAAVVAWNRASNRSDACLGDAIAAKGAAAVRMTIANAAADRFDSSMLLARFDQFNAESNEIVPAASDALAGCRLVQFGSLVDRSQDLTERLLGNQVPETIALVRDARRLGAAAASAFGAGFGGSVWALVGEDDVHRFVESWRSGYVEAFPEAATHARFLVSRPGRPAGSIIELRSDE
jgi:galactokinase